MIIGWVLIIRFINLDSLTLIVQFLINSWLIVDFLQLISVSWARIHPSLSQYVSLFLPESLCQPCSLLRAASVCSNSRNWYKTGDSSTINHITAKQFPSKLGSVMTRLKINSFKCSHSSPASIIDCVVSFDCRNISCRSTAPGVSHFLPVAGMF